LEEEEVKGKEEQKERLKGEIKEKRKQKES
jgi:hypothetical protein